VTQWQPSRIIEELIAREELTEIIANHKKLGMIIYLFH
jgi:hypothetical protein